MKLKKSILIMLITFIVLFSSNVSLANEDIIVVPPNIDLENQEYLWGVSSCYDGDLYSVDYVFDVPVEVEVLSVASNYKNCIYNWDFIKSESKLYISIESKEAIPKMDTLLTVKITGKLPYLALLSVKVNGEIKGISSVYHITTPIMDYVAPTFDTPGQFGGEKCSKCGIVIIEPTLIKPTGPIVNANLSNDNTLIVAGGLSDNSVAEGLTFVAVYDVNKRMIGFYDASEEDQSSFSVSFENCKDVQTVKVMRWRKDTLKPLCKSVEITVSK